MEGKRQRNERHFNLCLNYFYLNPTFFFFNLTVSCVSVTALLYEVFCFYLKKIYNILMTSEITLEDLAGWKIHGFLKCSALIQDI